jgi:putative flippase GtrA
MTVGGLATLVSFVGFNALVHGLVIGRAPLRDQPILAYVLANVVAGVVAYVGLRVWAFRDRTSGDTASGLVKFFALGAVTMAVPTVCLYVSRYALGLSSPLADNISANVIGLGLSAAARFWVFRRYVFDGPTPSQA